MIWAVGLSSLPPDGKCQAHHLTKSCRLPSDIILVVGCVHEHVSKVEVCESCRDIMTGQTLEWWCSYCRKGNDPHECTIQFISEERLDDTRVG